MDLDTGSDVVLASAVSIARNISGFKFITAYTAEEKSEIQKKLITTADRLGLMHKAVSAMDHAEKTWLIEEALVSEGFGLDSGNYIIQDTKHKVYGVVCDDNHMTIRTKAALLDIQSIYENCCELADSISDCLKYAYNDDFGFLTTNIDELGTGISFSFLVHVPAMSFSGELSAIFRQILETGCEITSKSMSAFGPNGAFFTVKLPVIPRENEQLYIDKIEPAMRALVVRERAIRKTLCDYQNTAVLDRIGRSYGISRYAFDLSYEEFLSVVSDLRLGILLGILEAPAVHMLDKYALHDPIHDTGLNNAAYEETEAQYRASLMKKIAECITFNERHKRV